MGLGSLRLKEKTKPKDPQAPQQQSFGATTASRRQQAGAPPRPVTAATAPLGAALQETVTQAWRVSPPPCSRRPCRGHRDGTQPPAPGHVQNTGAPWACVGRKLSKCQKAAQRPELRFANKREGSPQWDSPSPKGASGPASTRRVETHTAGLYPAPQPGRIRKTRHRGKGAGHERPCGVR